MGKYNKVQARPAASGPLVTETVSSVTTHEGGTGYARDAKSELFLRATGSFAGEDGFYEKAGVRDDRLRELTAGLAVTPDGHEWMGKFLPWLRKSGFMRTAPLLIAAEAVHARLAAGLNGGNRQLVEPVLQRADEPGEFLAYWHSRFGRDEPKPVKRGVADAVQRLYSEYGLLKYDTASHGFRFGDVIERTHPAAKAPWQGDLYEHAIDRRHGRDNPAPDSLVMVRAQETLRADAAAGPGVLLDAARLRDAGMTWEDALSLAGKDADKKALWEALIPRMGIFALLRNLRNFDQAGVSDAVAEAVAAKISDPRVIGKSMIFPYQLWAAHREVPSLRWGQALERALDASCSAIPVLDGRTLVLIDTSASMGNTMSGKSRMRMVDAAALFGLAVGVRNAGRVDVHGFADGQFKVTNIGQGASVLKSVEAFSRCIGNVGHGTQIEAAVRATYARHDRVIIFTDMQTFRDRSYYGPGDVASAVPAHVPVYGFNLAGYSASAMAGGTNRHELGGLTDATFRLVPLIETAQRSDWDALFNAA
jgi:TROVE domain